MHIPIIFSLSLSLRWSKMMKNDNIFANSCQKLAFGQKQSKNFMFHPNKIIVYWMPSKVVNVWKYKRYKRSLLPIPMYPGDLYSECPICMAFYYISFVLLIWFHPTNKNLWRRLGNPHFVYRGRERWGWVDILHN